MAVREERGSGPPPAIPGVPLSLADDDGNDKANERVEDLCIHGVAAIDLGSTFRLKKGPSALFLAIGERISGRADDAEVDIAIAPYDGDGRRRNNCFMSIFVH